MRLGIFGGTFDPPHIGHQILASEALEQLVLDQVLWVLTHYPPHKKEQKISSITDRVQMVEFAIEDNLKFILSRVDIDRKPPHYALETVLLIKKNFPNTEAYYLMGMDSLNDLLDWYHPAELVSACDGIVVMNRNGTINYQATLYNEIPELEKKLHILKTPYIEISSSMIRDRVTRGEEYRYFLPVKVFHFIRKLNLYRD